MLSTAGQPSANRDATSSFSATATPLAGRRWHRLPRTDRRTHAARRRSRPLPSTTAGAGPRCGPRLCELRHHERRARDPLRRRRTPSRSGAFARRPQRYRQPPHTDARRRARPPHRHERPQVVPYTLGRWRTPAGSREFGRLGRREISALVADRFGDPNGKLTRRVLVGGLDHYTDDLLSSRGP